MAEQTKISDKPGTGVDRTLIRELLALSEPERAKVAIQAARNLAAIHARNRRS